jgi:hypothetical protein
VEDVEADHEVLEIVEIAHGESIEERAFEFERPQRVRRGRASVRQLHGPVRESADDRRFLLVSMMRTGRPGFRSTGTNASVLAASRSVVRTRGKSTTSDRASTRVTHPIPSSGLKRWVR